MRFSVSGVTDRPFNCRLRNIWCSGGGMIRHRCRGWQDRRWCRMFRSCWLRMRRRPLQLRHGHPRRSGCRRFRPAVCLRWRRIRRVARRACWRPSAAVFRDSSGLASGVARGVSRVSGGSTPNLCCEGCRPPWFGGGTPSVFMWISFAYCLFSCSLSYLFDLLVGRDLFCLLYI